MEKEKDKIEFVLKITESCLARYKRISSLHRECVAEYSAAIDSLDDSKEFALADSMRAILANEYRLAREAELEVDRVSRSVEMLKNAARILSPTKN